MSKTAPGPKELAQRELGKQTREDKSYRRTLEGVVEAATRGGAIAHEMAMASRPEKPKAKPGRKPGPKKPGLIPYAGKPRGDSTLYGRKPGPKAPRKPKL